MSHPAEQQAQARQSASLTGRHKAPTGAPASTNVRVGEEGTPSRGVVAHLAGVPASQAIFSQPRRPAGAPRA